MEARATIWTARFPYEGGSLPPLVVFDNASDGSRSARGARFLQPFEAAGDMLESRLRLINCDIPMDGGMP